MSIHQYRYQVHEHRLGLEVDVVGPDDVLNDPAGWALADAWLDRDAVRGGRVFVEPLGPEADDWRNARAYLMLA